MRGIGMGLMLAALLAAGCNKGAETGAGTPASTTGTAAAPTGQDSLMQALIESNRLKDSLLVSVFAADSFIEQVGAEISKVKNLSSGMVTPQVGGEGTKPAPSEYRQQILTRLQELTTRLQRAENRLAANRKQIRDLTKDNAYLQNELSGYEKTVANFSAKIDRQQAQIDSLFTALGALEQERAALAAAKEELEDTVSSMTVRENTAYYIVGTKDELKAKGIIVQEGGKFLFLGKKSWQPSRGLDPSDFTAIDLRQVREIPFPKADKPYRIVSRHDLQYVETNSKSQGKFTGSLRITSPKEFWAASKFLILVED